jgi:uroporphyrin-III C-methyltransferase
MTESVFQVEPSDASDAGAAATFAPGTVCIVGAGPGAADLLTLRALQRLQQAEVVVHDRLIAPEVLALVPARAQRVYVGKALGDHAVPQPGIHTLLIEHARAGRRVVRLKGGDPYVFGRGSEEVQALQAAGIACEVVPGVTAAGGCAAAAGIPLTHRDLASSCVFLSGHLAEGNTPQDWAALVRPGQTRVFYMGVQRLAYIAQQLIAHGLSPNTPAAIVRDGTRSTQSVIATSLSDLVRQAPVYGPNPGLLIIGETVSMSADYRPPAPAASDAPPADAAHRFSVAERDILHRVIETRRDMRHFSPGLQVERAALDRLLRAAHHAPSVGLMQPWRFIRITDVALRERIAEMVDAERLATAAALGGRADAFLQLKVEGVRDCAELLVAALAPDDGTVFGRRTLPQEMAICSLACAVQNLWLAARAENLGLGWVSMFEPAALASLLQMPDGAKPLALLCVGPVDNFYAAPMLEKEGWRSGRELDSAVFEGLWGRARGPEVRP